MSFEQELDQGLDLILAKMTQVTNAAILSTTDAIIDDTPVATGALKGSWTASADTPAVQPTPREDPTGTLPKLEMAKVLYTRDVAKSEGEVYLSNGQSYAGEIEFEGKSHIKAPEGMVRKNLAAWETTVNRLAGV